MMICDPWVKNFKVSAKVETECVECAKRREDSNPWRYPSRGELPEKSGIYEVSVHSKDDGFSYVAVEHWYIDELFDAKVYAWRELPEPAPEPEGDGTNTVDK